MNLIISRPEFLLTRDDLVLLLWRDAHTTVTLRTNISFWNIYFMKIKLWFQKSLITTHVFLVFRYWHLLFILPWLWNIWMHTLHFLCAPFTIIDVLDLLYIYRRIEILKDLFFNRKIPKWKYPFSPNSVSAVSRVIQLCGKIWWKFLSN